MAGEFLLSHPGYSAIVSPEQALTYTQISHVALAWINKRVTSPIIGFSKVERLDEAISARGKVLTEEEEKYLEELYQPKAINGHS